MNRIQQIIDRVRQTITMSMDSGRLTPEKHAELSKKMIMQPDEHAHFQELKSLAFASGELTEGEAMLLYRLLGNTVDTFNNQSLPVRVALTQIQLVLSFKVL